MARQWIVWVLCLVAGSAGTAVAGPLEEANKATLRHIVEQVWTERNLDYIRESTGGDLEWEESTAFIEQIFVDFPDYQLEILDMVAEGDKIVLEWRGTGTCQMPGSEGKAVDITGLTTYVMKDGKVVDRRSYMDSLDFMIQLGYQLTPPGASVDKPEGKPEEVSE